MMQTPSMPGRPCALIIGVGEVAGIGGAVALHAAREGLPVVVVGRTPAKLAAVVTAIERAGGTAHAHACNLAEPTAIEALFATLAQSGHIPEFVVFNAAYLNMPRPLMRTTTRFLEGNWQVTALAGILCAQAAAQAMVERGRGTILITGASASMRGKPLFAAFAAAKASLRAFTACLAHEVAPLGVHVAHVVIDGVVHGDRARQAFGGLGAVLSWLLKRDGRLQPADVAATYWALHQQPSAAWTHELDMRPHQEPF
jgi:NAD(P)-dependent dehydrogenase (short-subunit alcohol dehydrogenase family)